MELGNKGEEQYEDVQADRTILNGLISRKFRHNVNLTEFNIEHSKQSVLDKDGFHLLEKGGKMLAAAIAETTKELVNTPPGNPRDENPTPRITNRDNPIPEDISTELEIPPGIGRHVVDTNKKECHYPHWAISALANQINSMNKGKPTNVREVIEDITKIINVHLERQQKTTEKKKEQERSICKYYAANGQCRYGAECWQIHQADKAPAIPQSKSATDDQDRPSHGSRKTESHISHRSQFPPQTTPRIPKNRNQKPTTPRQQETQTCIPPKTKDQSP